MSSPQRQLRCRHLAAGMFLGWLSASAAQGDGVPPTPPPDPSIASIAELNEAFAATALTSEELVRLYLARIAAYDRSPDAAGRDLRSIITINAGAIDTARALDAERRLRGPRSPLHGIPVVLKDNIDTTDLATTAGSFVLAGSRPPDDAFVVRKLRKAGAVILAKANMSELASGPQLSSIGGQMRNPHDRERTPSGSSGGPAIAVAAAFASVALGTDTGGSVRGPAAANGIVGLKTTHGLVSRDGVVPLALSFDTVGPLARSVADAAALLSVIAGVDTADPSTLKGEGLSHDYLSGLRADALAGARIGVARDYLGSSAETQATAAAAFTILEQAGAILVDLHFPDWFRTANLHWLGAIMSREFPHQLETYLGTLGAGYPKTLDELRDRSIALTAPNAAGFVPNPARWSAPYLMPPATALAYQDRVLAEHAVPLTRSMLEQAMAAQQLDAIVYPSLQRPPPRIDGDGSLMDGYAGPAFLASLSGFPELVVPAGFDPNGLPTALSFLGPAFSEARLLALGHAFELRTRAYRLPVTTPAL